MTGMRGSKPQTVLSPSQNNGNLARLCCRVLLSVLYLVAGIFHIGLPAPFLSITPPWVPWPETVIFVTGFCEIAGAVGLHVPMFQKAAGIGLALYAIAVFPANINHALIDWGSAHPVLGWWYHVPRLLFQPVLVWAALYAVNLERLQRREIKRAP